MTTSAPSSVSVPDGSSGPGSAEVDLVLAGRAVASGQWIGGLIVAGQLDSVGTPRKLPADLFPGVDPVVVQEVWDRALAVGYRAGRLASAPRFNRDALERLRGQLVEAGHHAMAGMLARSLRTAAATDSSSAPSDDEIARGEH